MRPAQLFHSLLFDVGQICVSQRLQTLVEELLAEVCVDQKSRHQPLCGQYRQGRSLCSPRAESRASRICRRRSWSAPTQVDARLSSRSLPSSLSFEEAPLHYAVDLVTPVLWKHRRGQGSLPDCVQRFAGLFSFDAEDPVIGPAAT